jgi:hypothetical protein
MVLLWGDMVLLFAQAGLDHDLPNLNIPLYLQWQMCTTRPSFFPLRWRLANFFAQAGLEM